MSDLQYSREALRQLGSGLGELASTLGSDNDLRDVTTADVARTEVVDAIDHFAGSWNDKRDELVDSVTALSEMAVGVADGFGEADEQLAAAVRDILEGPA